MNINNLNIICNLNNYGALCFNGEDTIKFLQGQLTCNVSTIPDGSYSYGALCNTKGRIISFFKLLNWNNKFILSLPIELLDTVTDNLKKYILRSKVEMNNTTESIFKIGLVGDKIIQNFVKHYNVIFTKTMQAPSLQQTANEITPQNVFYTSVFASKDLFCILNNQLVNTLEIYCNSSNVVKNIYSALNVSQDQDTQGSNIQDSSKNNNPWVLIELRRKIPEIYKITSEEFLPHNLNLPKLNAVSFNKGCYRGQEIIARMEYKAKIKKSLQNFVAKTPTPEFNNHLYRQQLLNQDIFCINNNSETNNDKNSTITKNDSFSIGKIIRVAINENNSLEFLAEINTEALQLNSSPEALHETENGFTIKGNFEFFITKEQTVNINLALGSL